MKHYIRSFIVGSSLPVFVYFFIKVRNIPDRVKNYSYEDYTLIAPLYLGLMNALSLYLQHHYKLSERQRYVLIGTLSPAIVISFAILSGSYNFTPREWTNYALQLWVVHFIVFNGIIYSISQLIK